MASKIIVPRNMDQIIEQIYVGSYNAATMLDYTNRESISSVLNCTPDAHEGLKEFKVTQLNINDGEEIPHSVIELAITTIRESIARGEKILVHCHAGISRSPSLVCAYLISVGFSWDEAVDMVRNQRPQVYPHSAIERSIKNYFGRTVNPKTTVFGAK